MKHSFTSENVAGSMDGGAYVGLDTVEMDVLYGYPSASEAADDAVQLDGGDPGTITA